MNDKQIEQAVQESGYTKPRVTPDQINTLMAQVEYVLVQQPGNTTVTLCLAYLPGTEGRKFLLAQGTSACVEPGNFVAEIGERIARSKAESEARNKLWELEGYALFKELNRG